MSWVIINNMKSLFDEIDETSYRGFTTEQYNKAVMDYSDAMFDLFESDKKYGCGNLGFHLMWFGSWTQKFIAREVVDYSIENNQPLNISLIDVLKKTNNWGNEDLEKIKNIILTRII